MGLVSGLVRTSFMVNAVYAESAREYGITPQQGQLLCVLMAKPYGMGELGEVLSLAKSSLTGLVDRSERSGLVRRESDPRDTRAVRVAFTPEGRVLAHDFYAETGRRIDRLAGSLADAERDTLALLLGRIVRHNDVPAVFMELAEKRP
ncbi:MarR family winged helix-turn-helix transcriptional regulator [Streptomyces sp. bgisy027]|uniref:MarR family winged helix-turn-helix transcriptional regulator n=1 Tax=Streptomyces sp. bgisy027 TaxID=3413770 RepID=UPI003D71D880